MCLLEERSWSTAGAVPNRSLSGDVCGFKSLSEPSKSPSFLSFETGIASRRIPRVTCTAAEHKRHTRISRIVFFSMRIVEEAKIIAPGVGKPHGVLVVLVAKVQNSEPTVILPATSSMWPNLEAWYIFASARRAASQISIS